MLLASPQTPHVLRTIIELAQRFNSADAYAIWRKRDADGAWTLVSSAGLSEEFVRSGVAQNAGPGSRSLSEPMIFEDVSDEPFLAVRRDALRSEGVCSMLVAPLQVHGDITGTFTLYWKSPHRFTESEVRVACALGNMAAAALGTAELYERETALRTQAEASERRAAFLAEAGAVFASSLDYETTLRSIARLAIARFADWCSVDLARDGVLERVTLEHIDEAKLELAREYRAKFPPREDDALLVAFRTGQAMIAESISDELLRSRISDLEQLRMIRAIGIESLMIVPMVNRGRILGVLTFVSSRRDQLYTQADLTLAQELASRAAMAIDNAQLHADVRASEGRYRSLLAREQQARSTAELLNKVGQVLTADLDPQSLAKNITDLATKLVNAEFGALFHNVVNETGESYMLYTLSGVPEEAFAGIPMPRNTAVFAPTFRGEAVVRSEDITQDPRYGNNAPMHGMPPGHLPVRSYLAVPVVSRSGEVLGGLLFGHSQPAVFHEQAEEFAVGIASQAAIALDNARLFKQSQEVQAALRRSNDELRRANEDLNQFAYSASHDLQEPLRMVATFTQLLQRRYEGKLDGQADQYISYAVRGARHMEELLRDLLAYTQAANLSGEEAGPADANAGLEKALSNLEEAIAGSGARIEADRLPVLNVAEFHLIQLFQNLVGNAIKYAGNRVPQIRVLATRDSNTWLLAVRDNGIGIDPKYKDQIFGLFKRLHGSAHYSGTGIGLAICQKICERYGGKIWVQSELGKGATFYFTIPDRI